MQNIKDIPYTVFAPDDFVLVNYPDSQLKPGPKMKLLPFRRGPMQVVSRNKNTYSVKDLVTNKIEQVNVSRLVPFYYDARYTDPRQIANTDVQYYDVRAVLSHTGNKNRPSYMTFQVEWEPVGDLPASITTEPWASMRDTEALHIYLRNAGMANIIPRKFR
jgi:hypothetical protein